MIKASMIEKTQVVALENAFVSGKDMEKY